MKVGDSVNGYRITRPFTNAGGGQSEWTFVEKNGVSYFIKRFLKPTYPVDGGPGSERVRRQKRENCARFEEHHRTVERLLRPLSGPGGNLVVTQDFFRQGAHYFKVTDRVDNTTMPVTDIAVLPMADKVQLMLAVGNSLGILHRNGLVHGDLKPDNLLLRKASSSAYSVKLIDFDNCFAAGAPPASADLVGDPAYYSPELMAYLIGDGDPRKIAQASDIFALALVFCQYLTGQMPAGSHRGYLAEGMLRGGTVSVPVGEPGTEPVRILIGQMLAPGPDDRPKIGEVIEALKLVRRGIKGLGAPASARPGDDGSSDGLSVGGGLRGSLLRSPSADGASGASGTADGPKLRGSLLGQSKKKE